MVCESGKKPPFLPYSRWEMKNWWEMARLYAVPAVRRAICVPLHCEKARRLWLARCLTTLFAVPGTALARWTAVSLGRSLQNAGDAARIHFDSKVRAVNWLLPRRRVTSLGRSRRIQGNVACVYFDTTVSKWWASFHSPSCKSKETRASCTAIYENIWKIKIAYEITLW